VSDRSPRGEARPEGAEGSEEGAEVSRHVSRGWRLNVAIRNSYFAMCCLARVVVVAAVGLEIGELVFGRDVVQRAGGQCRVP